MYEFTPADPTIKRPGHEAPLSEKRKILFVYIPVIAFASMMADIAIRDNQIEDVVNLIFAIVMNVLALMWAKIDADERQYELSRYFTFAVVLFGVFAIIYYLFRSRGARDGLISTGWMVLYALALTVALGLISAIVAIVLIVTGALPQEVLSP
jgi:dipeptide/tripeptide permease